MAKILAGKLLFLLKLVNIYFVVDALRFTKQPDDTAAMDGADSVVLNCKVDDPSVEISWMKNNRPITVDYIKYTKIRRGLRIKPVEKSDAGVYHCLAGSALRSRDARLTIEYTCKNNFTIKSSGPIFRNGNATLTCNCPSIPTPTFKWQKDSKDINSTYQSIVITSTDVGKYVCIVQSGKITVKSQPYDPPVFDCLPSRISFPPKDKIPFVPNKPLTLECVAKGDPKPVVTWKRKKNNSPLKNNQRIQVNDNGTVRFFPTKRSDAGEYTCSASNNCGRSMTYTTTLTLAETGSFTPIQDTLSRVNMTITIRCNPPNGAFPVINKITWQMKDGSPLPNDSRFTVKDNRLIITQPQISDSNVYLCVGENIAGKVTVEAKVTVAVYPKAIMNPIGQTVIEGTTLQLKCKFGGNPKPEISWEKDKKALKENLRRNVTNMKDSSLLNLINVTKKETGSYRCVARLKHITERTYEAKVVVKENIVLQKIASDKFDVGTTAKLNCRLVAGYEPINIRWSKELNERSLTHMKVEGFKLVIENIRMKDKGNYTCYVNNSFSESSLTFEVNVYEYTKIVLKPSNVTVAKGENAWLHCNATGIPKPIIMWRKDNMRDEIKSVNGTRVHPNGTLMLSKISQEDKGWYICMAGNPGVIITEKAYVDIVNESNKNEGHSDNMGQTVGIAVGCAAAYIILVVGLMIYCKGRRARLAKKKLLINGEDVPLKPTDNAENGESAKAAELNNAKEYPRENLETLRTLGKGAYGTAFLAKAKEISEGESSTVVVVMSLMCEDKSVKEDFMIRMGMFSLKHENIAKLLGVCREDDPIYLITEYPEKGDLKTVMCDPSTSLTSTQKLKICVEVACGMNYLINHGHIHKDLATRNCLVNIAFDVKISFLSLNQGSFPNEYSNHKGELVPLRWMSPEALNGDYSDMTDVWAYGVLMWEVYTQGLLPYEERPDEEVILSIADDLRLTKPEGCPSKVYRIMEKCWANDKEDRPTFGQLKEDIEEIHRESNF